MTNRTTQSSWLLWFGFGSLLCLLGFAGLYGLSTIKTTGARNEHIRIEYLRRDRILQQMRADLYLAGTYIRDLLLEPNATQASSHRRAFLSTRDEVESLSAEYGRLLGAKPHPAAFDRFAARRRQYFELLKTTLNWTAEQRRTRGLLFMNDVLLPERAAIVQLADQLSLNNAHQLEGGSREVSDLFNQFERNLIVFTAGSLCVGAFLALFTARRLLRLELLAQQQLHELQNLSSRLVQVQESERRAIARELHDEVGQSVSGLLLGIGNVAATLSPGDHQSALSQLDDLRHLAEGTVASVRNLSLLLRPSMLDDLGLLPALQWQAREVSRTANISVEVAAEALTEDEVSEDNKICIYRIVQEALNNVVRHAHASAVCVRLSRNRDGAVILQIEDNGRGFRPTEKGLGILGMEERVRQRNGTLQIVSEDRRGTTLLIHLPA